MVDREREREREREGETLFCLSPTLFNIYINELAEKLHQCSETPGLSMGDTTIKCLLYADDLVLLSPTREGLQQSLEILDNFCKNWALKINHQKTKIVIFQKRSKNEGNYIYTIDNTNIKQSKTYPYLGITVISTGSFDLAVRCSEDQNRPSTRAQPSMLCHSFRVINRHCLREKGPLDTFISQR